MSKKNQKQYTFIIASNKSAKIKNFQFSARQVRLFFSILFFGFAGFLLLLFDYLSVSSQYIQNHQLTKKNTEILKNYTQIKKNFDELKTEFYQLKDFSKKIQMITNVQGKGLHSSKHYGKISSQIDLMSFPSQTELQNQPIIHSHNEDSSKDKNAHSIYNDHKEFVVEIKDLKKESKNLKTEAWTHYTNLLDKKRFIDHTPSIMPVNGWVSSHFGYRNESMYVSHEPYFHKGLDVAAKEGTPIVATASGRVVYTGYDEDGFGKLVVINHGYNVKTYYAHLSDISVKMGETVKKGWKIGEVGNTGNSRGSHLHYEVRVLGIPINPINYILDLENESIHLSNI